MPSVAAWALSVYFLIARQVNPNPFRQCSWRYFTARLVKWTKPSSTLEKRSGRFFLSLAATSALLQSERICSRRIALLGFNRHDEIRKFVVEGAGLEPSPISLCERYENIGPGDGFAQQWLRPRDSFELQSDKFVFA
jgi:hypothetical protein